MKLIQRIIERFRSTDKQSEQGKVICVDFHDGTLRKQHRELSNCLDYKIDGIGICCASQ